MILIFIIVVCVAVHVQPALAATETVNFEELAQPGTGFVTLGTSVTAAGFVFEADGILGVYGNESLDLPEDMSGVLSTSLLAFFAQTTIVMAREDGERFATDSIDLAEYWRFQTGTGTAQFVGIRADGTEVTQSFVFDNGDDAARPVLQTFFFNPGFTNLVSLQTTIGTAAGNNAFQFNNLTTSPIPLPASLPLLSGALATFGLLGRRKRSVLGRWGTCQRL